MAVLVLEQERDFGGSGVISRQKCQRDQIGFA